MVHWHWRGAALSWASAVFAALFSFFPLHGTDAFFIVDLRTPIRAPRILSTKSIARPRNAMPLQLSNQSQEDNSISSETTRSYKRIIYILRHGQTDFNAGGKIQGSSDVSKLTELGQSQAASLGKELSGASSRFSITNHVYISPLSRARHTYDILKDAAADAASLSDEDRFLPPTSREYILNNLREIDLYDWEGMHADDIIASHPESWAAWKAGDPHRLTVQSNVSSSSDRNSDQNENGDDSSSSSSVRYPLLELWERAQQVWDEIHAMEEHYMKAASSENLPSVSTSLIVCHGSLGQALLGTAVGRDADFFREVGIPNCGMVQLEWRVGHGGAARDVGTAHSWKRFTIGVREELSSLEEVENQYGL